MAGESTSMREPSDDRIFRDVFEAEVQPPGDLPRRALERFSYGATSASLEEFAQLGASDATRLAAWVDRQLAPASINDADC